MVVKPAREWVRLISSRDLYWKTIATMTLLGIAMVLSGVVVLLMQDSGKDAVIAVMLLAGGLTGLSGTPRALRQRREWLRAQEDDQRKTPSAESLHGSE